MKSDQPKVREVQRYALIGVGFGFLFPIISTLLSIIISQLPVNFSNVLLVQSTNPLLWVIDTTPLVLGLVAAYAGLQHDKVSDINEELFKREEELKVNQVHLEEIVKERTSKLDLAKKKNEFRAGQFEAINQVSRVINQVRELQILLPQITQLISEQFHFYHVGIFLIDKNNEFAILVAANSEGGQRMLARNHKLIIGQEGIVGNVSGSRSPRIAFDTGSDAIYFNNPDLPETRSEMALPLFRTGNQIIGVLDVQSVKVNAFGQEDNEILTTLADQVSIAIDNARLYEETQKALLDSETHYQSDISKGWGKIARSESISGIRRQGMKVDLLIEPVTIVGADEVTRSGNIYYQNSDKNNNPAQLTVPMKLRGKVVGMLSIKSNDDREWSTDEVDIITAIVERASLSIENARLLNESQKRASKERAIGDISAKIGGLVNIENLVQTAIQELGKTLPNTDIAIQFQNNQETK